MSRADVGSLLGGGAPSRGSAPAVDGTDTLQTYWDVSNRGE